MNEYTVNHDITQCKLIKPDSFQFPLSRVIVSVSRIVNTKHHGQRLTEQLVNGSGFNRVWSSPQITTMQAPDVTCLTVLWACDLCDYFILLLYNVSHYFTLCLY